MKIRPLGSTLGVEVTDVDVRGLGDADFARIYRAWLDHNGVLVVRDQQLVELEFLSYSERFGPLLEHPSKQTRHDAMPQLTVMGINKFDADGKLIRSVYARGGAGWHTDGAYAKPSFKATQLYAVAIPSRGGDTLFASMYTAYDELPQALKTRLEGRVGAFTYGGRSGASNALLNPEDRNEPPAHHPLLRQHPETGRFGLYFDPGKILRIEGLPTDESDALLDELTERMVTSQGQYRHQWSAGDIVIWDNRCTYHVAAADYPPHEDRIHWRVSIADT